MKPTADNIFAVKVTREIKKTEKNRFEGIDSRKASVYKVVAVGSEVKRCKVDDFILFNNGITSVIYGRETTVLTDNDVVGVEHA